MKCESCRIADAEIEEPIEAGTPYHVCKACHHRLVNQALRPLEFFNLTALHGYAYYLHDDFYDSDTGIATAPDIEVEDAEMYPFPLLDDIKGDIERLIDYAIVQYATTEEVLQLLQLQDKETLLKYIDKRLKDNEALAYKIFEIVPHCFGRYAESWVRDRWKGRKDMKFSVYAQALACCLPFEEAFNELTQEIEKGETKLLADNALSLLYFENPATLDWIEHVMDRIVHISGSWGMLAAASKFDWSRARKWLNKGRPLSLIALDALIYCTTIGDRSNQSLWLRENPPQLINPAPPLMMIEELNDYLNKDSVPRVKSAVLKIIENINKGNGNI